MNTTPFPHSIPVECLTTLHQVQQAAALLARLGDQLEGAPAPHQIGGMAGMAALMADRLDQVIAAIDAASTLPAVPGEGVLHAR